MNHPALVQGRVAVVTGAASGIGLAAAKRFVSLGMKVCMADRDGEALRRSVTEASALQASGGGVIAVETDVGQREQVEALKERVLTEFGEVALVMNNAGIEGGGKLFADPERWKAILDTNLWGVIHGVQVFAPVMVAQETPGAIVNTGSKQGITTPPGNTPYNVSKAGVKVVTEALAYELRTLPGGQVTAHLLIPGFVYTGLTKARGVAEKPAGAWTPEDVIDALLPAMARNDFYVLCPDNETTTEMDHKRIRWAADDIIENRPALSRWHADYENDFARFMAS